MYMYMYMYCTWSLPLAYSRKVLYVRSDIGESIPGKFSIDTSLLIYFFIFVADEIIVGIDEL